MYLTGRSSVSPLDIIAEFYDSGSLAFNLLLNHGRQVAEKAGVPVRLVYDAVRRK